MIGYCFILGMMTYMFAAYASNMNTWKHTWWFIPMGVFIGMVSNALWFTIAKHTKEHSQILLLGSYWDVMILACFLTIPFVFFEVNISLKEFIGIMIIFIGVVVTKL